MEKKSILSVFVDESGRFRYPDNDSRFYIIGMVFHKQSDDISDMISAFDRSIMDLGLDPESFVFHAGPLIRKEKGYEFFSRKLRGKIYSRMMAFARKIDFKWHCLYVDKKFINSSLQIVSQLQKQLDTFVHTHKEILDNVDKIRVYYDCGQSPVTNLLHSSFSNIRNKVEFAENVQPKKYKLFQLADLICSLNLVQIKINSNEKLTDSEYSFFGGLRAFRLSEGRFLKNRYLK